jgi:hypothetical protein
MASNLTTQQLATLKAAILAETNATFVGYRTNGQTGLMRDWLNKDKTPAVNAWRTDVQPQESDEATPWTAFDALSAGKRDSWNTAFMRYPRDFSRAKVRKWITDTWGAATAGSNAELILTDAGLRKITRAESILGGSTTATTGTVAALSLEWVGPLSDDDIIDSGYNQ